MSDVKKFKRGLTLEPVSADPSSPSEGQLQMSDGTHRAKGLWRYDGLVWQQTGAGGGGLDVITTETFETTNASDVSSGNNATFDNGGVFAGTLADETASPIKGDASLKYTTAAGSQNDFFYLPAITLEDKEKGQDVGLNFYYTFSGADDIIEVVVYDDTNNSVLTSSLDLLKSSTDATRFSLSAYIPLTCNSIKIGFHHTGTATASDVLVVDEVELTLNPFVYKELSESYSYYVTQKTNAMTDVTNEHRYNLATATKTGDEVGFEVVDDSTNARTKVNILREGVFDISYNAYVPANRPVGIAINDEIVSIGASDGANATSQASIHRKLNVGDFVTFGPCDGTGNFLGTSISTTQDSDLNITATFQSEHVVTPAKSNMTDWISYTPTTQGLGTISSADFKYRRIGDSIEVQGNFVTGTCDTSECQIGLPSGLTVASDYTANTYVGVGKQATATYSHGYIVTAGDTYFNNVQHNSGTYSPRGGTTVFYNSTIASFFARVKIEEYSGGENATFLAAVPVQKRAYIKVATGTQYNIALASTTSYKTRALESVEGDSEILSINTATDRMTLGAGKYHIVVPVGGAGGGFKTFSLYDVTNAAIYFEATSVSGSSSTSDLSIAHVPMTVEITDTREFEFRTAGGAASGNEYIGTIEVVKIK